MRLTHPKNLLFSLAVTNVLTRTGGARSSYIFGYRSKKVIPVDILWSSDGGAAADETIIGTANSLRDYFADVKRGRRVRPLGGQKRPRPPSLQMSVIEDPLSRILRSPTYSG